MESADYGYTLVINPLSGSKASAGLYRRNPDGSVALIEVTDAFIGRNGVGKQREGDGRTPCGELHAIRAFGILPNPGTSLEYTDVTPDTVACDAEGPYYNRIVSRRICADVQGEEMSKHEPEYYYGLETDYNRENVFPKGSAIFLHCKGEKTYTAGCVALDLEFMKRLVVLAGSGLKIIINPS